MDLPANEPGLLPSLRISLADVPPVERLERFRQGASTHQVSLPDGCVDADLSAEVVVWPIGPAMVLHSRLGPAIWRRTAREIQGDQLDHIQLNLTLSGRSEYEIGGRSILLEKGTLVLVDYRQTTCGTVREGIENLTITAPRSFFRSLGHPCASLHGVVIDGAAGVLLARHLQALLEYLPAAREADAAIVLDATVSLLRACVPRPSSKRRSSATDLTLDTLRHFIEENATRPECDVNYVARSLRVSRSTLYRLAESLGGVAAYIWQCRVERGAALIRSGETRLSIVRISQACGFQSPSHFSRAFRQRYGYSPTSAGTPAALERRSREEKIETYTRLVEEAGGVLRSRR